MPRIHQFLHLDKKKGAGQGTGRRENKMTAKEYKLLLTTQLASGDEKNHDLAPKLVAFALSQSFSHTSHHCGHDSSPPIAVYNTITGEPQYSLKGATNRYVMSSRAALLA